MQFSVIHADIEAITSISAQDNLVKRAINRALDRISGSTRWNYLLTRSFFTLVDDYSTGTVAITAGDTAITGTNTVFTSAMVGMKIKFGSDSAYYTIKTFTSTTAIVLEEPYQGSTLTAGTYVIYQDEYRLAPDLDMLQYAKQIATGQGLVELDPGDYEIMFPTPDAYGDPQYITPIGRRQDTYSTGTLSGTISTSVLTGASTAWTSVQGLGRGSRITIGSTTYTVKSVDSATQLTIYETLSAAIAALTTYSIVLDNLRVAVYQLPDNARNIYYRYYRKPAPLNNDADEPDLPPSFHWLLLHGALSELWAHKGDDTRRMTAEKTFIAGIQQMKTHFMSNTRVYRRKPQMMIPNRRGPRYPSEYDVSAHF